MTPRSAPPLLLVTGAGGMLGSAFGRLRRKDLRICALDRQALDVTDAARVARTITSHRPDTVVHLAAWTDVDGCERDLDRARRVNEAGARHVALACASCDATLVLVSSLAVFDGTSPSAYAETDRPSPINVYGATKLQAESIVQELVAKALVVRTGWLFSGRRSGDHKFVGQMLANAHKEELAVIHDTYGSPTFTDDLALAIAELVATNRSGLYHVVNAGGPVSRLEIAREIFDAIGSRCRVRPVAIADYPTAAPRPRMEAGRSVRLENETGIRLRPWREALREALDLTARDL